MPGSTVVTHARTFGTPEDALKALSVASSASDDAALQAIFGPDYDQIKDPDPAQAARDLAVFNAAIAQTNRIVRQSDTNCIVAIGTNAWPFPIPLVKQGARGASAQIGGVATLAWGRQQFVS